MFLTLVAVSGVPACGENPRVADGTTTVRTNQYAVLFVWADQGCWVFTQHPVTVLADGGAATHLNGFAGHKTRDGRCEVHDRTRDFLGRAHALDGLI